MRVGPYEIGRQLGEGGVGRVLLGRAPDGREVAIKVLRDRRPDALARFAREARLTASLGTGEGFVPVLDLGTSPELGPYVVFLYLPGGTLRERLMRGPLAVDAAVELGRRLALALGRAHALGVVHRDVKPENVLFTLRGSGVTDGRSGAEDFGDALLADLGLAKHFDREAPGASQSAALSKSGAFLGTAAYMPWEQFENPRAVGPAADVFALGCLVYECLAGHVPFSGATVLEHLAAVEAGRFEPLRSVRAGVPADVAHAVERALARDPARRYADGFAFAEALAPTTAADRRSRALPAALALAGALVLLAVGSGLGQLLVGRRAPEPARLPVSSPTPPTPRASPLPRSSPPPRSLASPPNAAVKARLQAILDSGDWNELEREASLEIDRDPRQAAAWSARALGHLVRDQFPLAGDDAEHALALDEADAVARLVRGEVRRQKKDLRGAEEDLARATALDPRSMAWIKLSEVRRLLGDLPGALAAGDRAVALFPKASAPWEARAKARRINQDVEGGIADATRAIELGTASVAAWDCRGRLLFAKGDQKGARADFDRVIAYDPREPDGWGQRGAARRRMNDFEGATSDFEEYLAVPPSIT